MHVLNQLLMLRKLLFDVQQELAETVLRVVIDNQFRNDGFVDLCRRELVRVSLVDHRRQRRKVLRYLRSAILHNEEVLVAHFLDELVV